MPNVNITITAGATREQKAALVRDAPASLVRELAERAEHVHVVMQEIIEDNWGFAGQFTDEWKLAQTAKSPGARG